MALRLHAPVVPLHLEGMFEIMSLHDSWPKAGRARLKIGKPLTADAGEDYCGFHEPTGSHVSRYVVTLLRLDGFYFHRRGAVAQRFFVWPSVPKRMRRRASWASATLPCPPMFLPPSAPPR